ncbi:hypothetical protein RIF29_10660 [Crotalaria pallida]|uniref:Uncharacterized protein n=1 Tax=Crotalaria pallida TaxID=3830 RepID=A0AAN9IJZ2_CROPI
MLKLGLSIDEDVADVDANMPPLEDDDADVEGSKMEAAASKVQAGKEKLVRARDESARIAAAMADAKSKKAQEVKKENGSKAEKEKLI